MKGKTIISPNTYLKGFKTELDPNNEQITMFKQHAGCARFTYNWALATLEEDYKSGKKELKPTSITLHKLLNTKKDTEFPWMRKCSKWAMQNATRSIEEAYKRFFKHTSKFPQKKKKGKRDSFTLDKPIYVFENYIQLPKIGKVRLKEKGYIPTGNPKSATISLKVGRWFVAIKYEIPESIPIEHTEDSIGVDLGIKTFATFSDGTIIPTNNKLKKKEKYLKRQQRKLSRQVKGSNSRNKTKRRISKTHYHIANTKKDLIHKTTSLLAKTKLAKRIVIEDLNVKGMLKNHKLAKAIANIGYHEFRRQLTYKCEWYNKELVIADRWFPSSKMDHKTGEINNDLTLRDRIIFHKDETITDRDLNAAINLANYKGINQLTKKKDTVRYTGIKADGEERFIVESQDDFTRCSSMKSEKNIRSRSDFRFL